MRIGRVVIWCSRCGEGPITTKRAEGTGRIPHRGCSGWRPIPHPQKGQ